jgi:CRP/FNR family transcriptional regulator, cyclic AMP receptor protein
MTAVGDAIGRVPMFAKLSKRDLKELSSLLSERTFPAGTVITDVGDSGVGFFLIDSGTATVTINGKVVRTVSSGDSFGEIALIDQGPRTATVTADTDLGCYVLAAFNFRPFVKSHPDVAWALLEALAQRIRENLEV